MRAEFDREAWEERAAIIEFDAGKSRTVAETMAAELQGYTLAEARRRSQTPIMYLAEIAGRT